MIAEQPTRTYGNLWLVCSSHSQSWWLNPAFPGNDETIGKALEHFTDRHDDSSPCVKGILTNDEYMKLRNGGS